ncbi:MAG: sulfotransferase domain-containing protein [Nitrospirota bacterium]
MIDIQIPKDKSIATNSAAIRVSGGKKYKATTEAMVFPGAKYSAYFSIIFLDTNGKEIIRRIRWLGDSANKPIKYTLIAEAPKDAKTAVLAYRVNTEGTLRFDNVLKLRDVNSLILSDAESEGETYDELDDYLKTDEKGIRIEEFVPLTKKGEDRLEERLVWILCFPRSGSSWLARQLLSHPEHIIWDEPYLGLHLGAFIGNQDAGNFSRIFEDASNSTQYFFLPLYEKVWLPFLRSMTLNRCYAQFPDSLNKAAVIIKEPGGSRGSDIIMKSLPHSRMIFLLRDPRDLIDSHFDLHREDSWIAETWRKFYRPINTERRKDLVKLYSYNWLFLIGIIFKAYQNHDPNRRLLIKYEHLRFHTFNELKKIYEFIKTPISDIELNHLIEMFSFENIPKEHKGPGKFARKAKPGGWMETFTEQEKEIMNSIMGDKLREFGYEV